MSRSKTVIPAFDLEQFARATVDMTVLPPSSEPTSSFDFNVDDGGSSEKSSLDAWSETDYPDAFDDYSDSVCTRVCRRPSRNATVDLVPRWEMPTALQELDLSHRSSFVLCHVDGVSTVSDISVTSRVPIDEVIAILVEVVGRGALSLAGASQSSTTMLAPKGSESADDGPNALLYDISAVRGIPLDSIVAMVVQADNVSSSATSEIRRSARDGNETMLPMKQAADLKTRR